MLRIFMIILLVCVASSTFADAELMYKFSSAQQEQRFNNLIHELRCVVCQNQSLAESNAPLAKDLRNEVFLKIQDNWSDESIKKFLVNHYGEYILLKPVLKNNTYVLWLGPLLLLIGGFTILFITIKRNTVTE